MTKLYFISNGRIIEFNPQNAQGAHIKSILVWDKDTGFFEVNLSIPRRERINSMSAYELRQALEFLEAFYHDKYADIDEGLQFAFSELTPYKLEGTPDELAKNILQASNLPQETVKLLLQSVDKIELIEEEQKRLVDRDVGLLEDSENGVVWIYQRGH